MPESTVSYKCEVCWARADSPERIEHRATVTHPTDPEISRYESPTVMWCGLCQDHYDADHYDADGNHRAGVEFGRFGADLAARAIVADLAKQNCWVEIPVSTITDETATVCITCDAIKEGTAWFGDRWITGPRDHDESCPWRRAVEWVQALTAAER